VLEHAFTMDDFPLAETPGVGSVQARRVALEPVFPGFAPGFAAERKANDHEADSISAM
jgi:hypothetical protein